MDIVFNRKHCNEQLRRDGCHLRRRRRRRRWPPRCHQRVED